MKTYDDWMRELDGEKKAHEDYRKTARRIVKRYEDDEDNRNENQFNILWSNTEVLHAAMYAKKPSPDIRRRFLDKDPAGKKAATLAERAVSYALDVYDFNAEIDRVVNNCLVPGMGNVRLRYKPYYEMGEPPRIDLEVREKGIDPVYLQPFYGVFNGDEEQDDWLEDENGVYLEGEPEEEVVYEEVYCEYVNYDRWRWQPCARWDDCDWVAIEHYPTKEELDDDDVWKEFAEQIPLGYTDEGEKTSETDDKARAKIYEIFDKKTRKHIQIAEGFNEILSEVDDPLGLESFYPFPKPLVSTLKTGKFLPIPDYVFYQDQALELDEITLRINKITEQMKYRGVYDGSFEKLQNVSTADDGTFIPVDDFQVRFEGKGDLSRVIAAMPLGELQSTLGALFKARDEVKQVIYEITGIADIMRGASKAGETLGAQQIKTQFGSMRMSKRQREVARFVRDVIRLKVELMVENFAPETLQMMTGIEVDQEVWDILQNDMMRSYRIDIETDSTILEDQGQEKEQRIELVTAVTGFIEKVGPMVQMGLMPANVAKELLGFAVRGFKIGRSLEEVLDEMGGDEGDPREVEMKQQIEQFKQQLQEQMQGQVQQIQQQAGQQVKQLEGKLFQAEKKNAISGAVNEAKMFETQTKAEITNASNEYKAQLDAFIELLRAQMASQQQEPLQRMDDLGGAMNQIAQIISDLDQRNSATFEQLRGEIGETRTGLTEAMDFMKRPAKITRDERGKVTGAVRE